MSSEEQACCRRTLERESFENLPREDEPTSITSSTWTGYRPSCGIKRQGWAKGNRLKQAQPPSRKLRRSRTRQTSTQFTRTHFETKKVDQEQEAAIWNCGALCVAKKVGWNS